MKQAFAPIGLVLAAWAVPPAFAQSFALPTALDEVIGAVISVAASREETLPP